MYANPASFHWNVSSLKAGTCLVHGSISRARDNSPGESRHLVSVYRLTLRGESAVYFLTEQTHLNSLI